MKIQLFVCVFFMITRVSFGLEVIVDRFNAAYLSQVEIKSFRQMIHAFLYKGEQHSFLVKSKNDHYVSTVTIKDILTIKPIYCGDFNNKLKTNNFKIDFLKEVLWLRIPLKLQGECVNLFIKFMDMSV